MLETNFNEAAKAILDQVSANGFDLNSHEEGTQLMLITSELGEALEAARKGRYASLPAFDSAIQSGTPFVDAFKENVKDTFEDEIADALIRILHTCAARNIDIDRHVAEKMRYNATRPFRHGKKF